MAFDKIKQLNELRKMRTQALEMQKEMKKIVAGASAGDNKASVNAAQEVTYLVIDGQERGDIVKLINEAFKKVQKDSAKKMMEMGGGLSGLLKGLS